MKYYVYKDFQIHFTTENHTFYIILQYNEILI